MSPVESKTLIESYPAVPASVPLAREELVEFAAAAGASEEQLDAVTLAASEALTNVVVHAYPARLPGRIHVTAALTSSELWVLVADDGRGFRARGDSPGLGIGLALIAQVSDDFAIVKRSSGGTELRMRFSLRTGIADGQLRGSSDSAASPASSRFSTTL